MSPSNVWQVMTPFKDHHGDRRWWPVLIVAEYEHDAVRIAEQAAGALGLVFDGDVELRHHARCYAEAP